MKIRNCSKAYLQERAHIFCPRCHQTGCPYLGRYFRKGFHRKNPSDVIVVAVSRYLCLNPACEQRTFSVLPSHVLPYCRFFWPSLLRIMRGLAAGIVPSYLSQLWHVSRRVIIRAATLLGRMDMWIGQVHQEVCDGGERGGFEAIVETVLGKLGRVELTNRWYCHYYPGRFMNKNMRHTIRHCSVNYS
jgi:hypothetical protein